MNGGNSAERRQARRAAERLSTASNPYPYPKDPAQNCPAQNNPNKRGKIPRQAKADGVKTKMRIRTAFFYGALSVIFAVVAGFLVSFHRQFWRWSILSLWLFFLPTALGFKIDFRRYQGRRLAGNLIAGTIAAVGTILCIYLLHWENKQLEIEESLEFSGTLKPGRNPTPAVPTGVDTQFPTNAMLLFLGNSLAWTTHFPHPVYRFKKKDVITIDTNSNGLLFSCDFYDYEGKILASVQNNKFEINPRNSWHLERPNPSTLRVRDQKNVQRVDIEFLNPRAIRLLGRLVVPGNGELVIDPTSYFVPGFGTGERNSMGGGAISIWIN